MLHLVQVVGAGVHPLPQDVPLLSSEEPPEGREAVDLQAVQPDRHERHQRNSRRIKTPSDTLRRFQSSEDEPSSTQTASFIIFRHFWGRIKIMFKELFQIKFFHVCLCYFSCETLSNVKWFMTSVIPQQCRKDWWRWTIQEYLPSLLLWFPEKKEHFDLNYTIKRKNYVSVLYNHTAADVISGL